jgi:hypothetical protein
MQAKLSAEQISEARRKITTGGKSLRSVARYLKVDPATLSRSLRRGQVTTVASKSAPLLPSGPYRPPPRRKAPQYSWDLESIRSARDAQMRGDFERPVRLAEAIRTDDALFIAYQNRIAPQLAIASRIEPRNTARGKAISAKAKKNTAIEPSTLQSIHGTLANHAIAVGCVKQHSNKSGTCVRFDLEEWPLEHVRWNPAEEQLETAIKDGYQRVPIIHGDGTWIVFRKFGLTPWTQDAALLAAALLWPAHAEGIRDWAGASMAHGLAKIVGELPEGVSLQGDERSLTPEAQWFLQMLTDLASGDAVAGIRPAGAKTDFLANGSTAWQVFKELIINREKAAARIYCGTDATLGSVGGAPGVDIAALFGVATTRIQGDFHAIERALNTGFFEPWTLINFGAEHVAHAPRWRYQMPDIDSEAKANERSANITRLMVVIAKMKEQGFAMSQEIVNRLASDLNVSPAPLLAIKEEVKIPLQLAPTDIAKVVRVDEARQSQSLPAIGDERGQLMISELEGEDESATA